MLLNTPARPEIITPLAPAMAARPRITTKVRVKISTTRYIEREITRFADVLLIDRLHYRGQLSDRQHEAACRLYSLWFSAGMPGRTTARLTTTTDVAEEDGEAIEADEDDEAARDAYNTLLRDAGAAWAELLAGLCHDQHPGTFRLAAAHNALDWLGDVWGMEK